MTVSGHVHGNVRRAFTAVGAVGMREPTLGEAFQLLREVCALVGAEYEVQARNLWEFDEVPGPDGSVYVPSRVVGDLVWVTVCEPEHPEDDREGKWSVSCVTEPQNAPIARGGIAVHAPGTTLTLHDQLLVGVSVLVDKFPHKFRGTQHAV